MPDGGAGETIDHGGGGVVSGAAGAGIEKLADGAGGGLHLFRGALADAFGLAVTPDIGGQDGLVAFINQIAHGLAHEMGGDGVAGESMLGKQCPFLRYIVRLSQGAVDFEMIAPAGEFHAVVAHGPGLGSEFREREIGPLAGEKGDDSWHKQFIG